MEAYTSFAQVYDLFMDNVPYEQWADYIEARLKENGIENGTVLDLGCGTGKMTRIMAEKGYDMIGIDNAMEMLDIAMNSNMDSENEDIVYLLQDMVELELGETVDAVFCACDCLNYVLQEEDLLSSFKCVYNHLGSGGIFVFDMNTKFKYEELLGENTFAENREEGSFIWENYYDEENQINEYYLTLFIANEAGSFDRFEETHYQRAYETDTVLDLVRQAGFEIQGIYDGYTLDSLQDDSDRMSVVCIRK